MNIREMRTRLGDTQSQFAQRYQIPFRTIQNWEAGTRKPPEYMIKLLNPDIIQEEVTRVALKLSHIMKWDTL